MVGRQTGTIQYTNRTFALGRQNILLRSVSRHISKDRTHWEIGKKVSFRIQNIILRR